MAPPPSQEVLTLNTAGEYHTPLGPARASSRNLSKRAAREQNARMCERADRLKAEREADHEAKCKTERETEQKEKAEKEKAEREKAEKEKAEKEKAAVRRRPLLCTSTCSCSADRFCDRGGCVLCRVPHPGDVGCEAAGCGQS